MRWLILQRGQKKIENDLGTESRFRRGGTKLNASPIMTSTIGYGSAGLPTTTAKRRHRRE
jgi:hypothetical protein